MFTNFTYFLLSSNGIYEEKKIKQLIEMYIDDLDCSKYAAIANMKICQQKFVKTRVFQKMT